ncbi:MAG: acyl-CoA desaturase [Nitrospinaceae bacterium]|nr:acyl-CoA desaturase [Nitrospinaceae bacterium]NIR55578.1 acyl-CoA desaturase [Nitrospinaceae bacterium]NIS86012.1 acyl-CoA desaturase [Nitrospinaceae bacterium]NIT82858.1 acyl-CoA desaturase [Nitrospinaceae bacterium]NIU45060.1 acyl-CoA desaturase [Nitrospinaceae bacterium]
MGEVKPLYPRSQLSYTNVTGFVVIHLIASTAIFFPEYTFSWSAVAVMALLVWMTGSLGICLGFHRYLTHRSFELPKWLANFFVLMGTLAMQTTPVTWVGQHRMHHANSDTDKDPYNARRGLWWSHLGWALHKTHDFDDKRKLLEYTKDFSGDPFYRFLHEHMFVPQVILGVILFLLGGLPWVVWGIFVRLAVVYQQTLSVNSAAHKWGYKNFETDDLATNLWWVGLFAWGEGWHNNHHAFPKSARHGLRPWEFDSTWMVIRLLKALGLATQIQVAEIQSDGKGGYLTAKVVKEAA